MKTDLQKFLDLYNQLGIRLKVEHEDDGRKIITMRVGDAPLIQDRFSGYENIFCDVIFDKNEKMISQQFMMDI
jgi:hypothetical protein